MQRPGKRESPVNKERILALDKTRDKWTLPGTIATTVTLHASHPRRCSIISPRGAALSSHDAKQFRAFIQKNIKQ